VSEREDPTTHPEHDEIGCLQAIEMFYAYLDGELDDPRDIEDFEKHMEHCRSCFTRTEMEKLLTNRLKDVAEQRAPERLHRRVSKLIDEL
jgi:anti-sigma factor (TIGR02949 family)